MNAPYLDPGIRQFVERVRAIARKPLSEVATLREVKEAAHLLAQSPPHLTPAQRRVPARGYGRNLLHRDVETGFVVIAMVWPPGTGGVPHDHGTWGVVTVVEGEVEVTNFERQDDGSDASRIALRPLCTVHGKPGAIATVLPPHEDFHSVRNPSATTTAVSIHTYGREPADFWAVELATGRCEKRNFEYHSMPGT